MTSLRGQLLVARPYLTDPNFRQTVVFMFEHTAEGAAGVVINRLSDATISGISAQAFEEELEWEKPIGHGGPVPGPLVALHTREELADQEVLPGVYSTADASKLIILARSQVEPSRFVANYAGWGPGQLEAEMDEAAWLTLPATNDLIFCDDETELWKRLLTRSRHDQLASMVDIPEPPTDPRAN